MSSPIVYTKNGEEVKVATKFIYCSSVYCFWKNGASLMEEKRYASPVPLLESKIKMIAKKKNTITKNLHQKRRVVVAQKLKTL